MKFGFRFANLCGTVFKQGNVTFTPDGNSLLSPVGNRVTVFDLVGNTSVTLPFETRSDIRHLALSSDSALLLLIDQDGGAVLCNFHRRVVLSYFNFKGVVSCVQFSPDARFFAVGRGKQVQVWKTPPLRKEFAPFVLHRTFLGHFDDVVSLDWSSDSSWLISGSRDLTVRLHAVTAAKGRRGASPFVSPTLAGHRDLVSACFFSAARPDTIFSVSRDGALYVWRWRPERTGGQQAKHVKQEEEDKEGRPTGELFSAERPGRFVLEAKHYFMQTQAKVSCAALHKPPPPRPTAAGGAATAATAAAQRRELLVVGFTSGVFVLYDLLPEFTMVHSLGISQASITTAAINASGEWLAFGAGQLGQLLVWEWQSEQYVLKQQGHALDMNCVAYSPDGQLLATGSDDGKVKVWNAASGFCFVTFADHSGPVSGVVFTPVGNAVLTASLDGTVRAYDLTRYRNFRTMTSPRPAQFCSLALDPSGDLVCAGTLADTFEVYVWSVHTGRLLDTLAGHEAPVAALAFNPVQSMLASVSWDGTARLWDVFESSPVKESLKHQTDVLAVAWRPDGRELCTSALDGTLSFWDANNNVLLGTIEARKDVGGGRKAADRRTAANSAAGKAFTSVCYTADGSCILAGGNSKYICLYEVAQRLLLKKFQISHNRSLDGVLDFLNSKNMTEAGPLDLIDDHGNSDDELRARLSNAQALPGVQRGDLSKRHLSPAIRTRGVVFSPTGRAWAAASTEGLLIYSLDENLIFDPFELDIEVTPDNIRQSVSQRLWLKALVMSFRLNDQSLIQEVFEGVPTDSIQLVVQGFPFTYLYRLLAFIGKRLEDTRHVEFALLWTLHIFNFHGHHLKDRSTNFMSVFRNLQKSITQGRDDLAAACEDNVYSLDYLCTIGTAATMHNTGPAVEATRETNSKRKSID